MKRNLVLRGASKLCNGSVGSPCGLRLIQAEVGLVHDVLLTTSFPGILVSGKTGGTCWMPTIRPNVPAIQAGRFRLCEKR